MIVFIMIKFNVVYFCSMIKVHITLFIFLLHKKNLITTKSAAFTWVIFLIPQSPRQTINVLVTVLLSYLINISGLNISLVDTPCNNKSV